MINKKFKKQEGGFIEVIVILVLILIIASFMGHTPSDVWDNVLYPVIKFIWDAVVWISNFLILLLKDGGQALANLVVQIKSITGIK